jgi:hypothetical protein
VILAGWPVVWEIPDRIIWDGTDIDCPLVIYEALSPVVSATDHILRGGPMTKYYAEGNNLARLQFGPSVSVNQVLQLLSRNGVV